MSYPNPYTTTIRGDSNYVFTATSNAMYFQRAIVSLNEQRAAVFDGRGEGVPMTIQDGQQTECTGSVRGTTRVSILFQYSKDGKRYEDAVVAEALTNGTMTMIGTEDSNDGDNNDTVLTLDVSPL